MSGTPIISLFDLTTTQYGTLTWSDQETPLQPGYMGNLAAPVTLENTLPDLFAGIQVKQGATVRVRNVTRGSQLFYGIAGDPTISEIMSKEDLRGDLAAVRVRNLGTSANIMTLFGTVTGVEASMEEATLTISSTDTEMFNELIPKVRILDVSAYANADLSNVSDQDAPVIVPFGSMRKITFPQVATGGGNYDFGAIRVPAAGSVWLNSVYRDNRVVGRSEWSLTESPSGYYVIRFTVDQRDFNDRLMTIKADVNSSEFPSPSDAVRFILTDTTYGLRATVSSDNFDIARTRYQALSYTVQSGLSERQPAIDVLNQLLLHGAMLDKTAAGNYRCIVDRVGLHAPGTPSLGVGDNYWENIEPSSLKLSNKTIEERIRALTISGLFDPGFEGSGSYLLKANRNRNVSGKENEEQNPFIGDAVTLDTECDYRFKRLQYADQDVQLKTGLEARTLAPNDLVALYVPNMFIAGTQYELRSMRFVTDSPEQGQGGDAGFEMTLGGYNSAAFTYVPGTVQAAPTANTVTDYSMTPPGAVSNFTATPRTSTVTGTNQVESIIDCSADAPSVNVTHLVFQIFTYSASQTWVLPLETSMVAVSPGDTGVQAGFIVSPGLYYDLQCFARNINNSAAADAQDGAPSQQAHIGANNTPGAPATPATPTASHGTGKTIKLFWLLNTETNIAGYQVWRRATTNNSASATMIATVGVSRGDGSTHKGSYTDADSSLSYTTTYYYWLKAFNTSYPTQSGQISGFSANMGSGISPAKIDKPGDIDGYPWDTPDYGDDSVTTPKRQDYYSDSVATATINANTVDPINLWVLFDEDTVTFSYPFTFDKEPLVTIETGELFVATTITAITLTGIAVSVTNLDKDDNTATVIAHYW